MPSFEKAPGALEIDYQAEEQGVPYKEILESGPHDSGFHASYAQ